MLVYSTTSDSFNPNVPQILTTFLVIQPKISSLVSIHSCGGLHVFPLWSLNIWHPRVSHVYGIEYFLFYCLIPHSLSACHSSLLALCNVPPTPQSDGYTSGVTAFQYWRKEESMHRLSVWKCLFLLCKAAQNLHYESRWGCTQCTLL